MRSEQEMLGLILDTARQDERIRAVILNGSRANPNAPRDPFQDYDVVYVVTDVAPYKRNLEYIKRFGDLPNERQKYAQPLPVAGTPEDIGYCAVYLASDESKFVTGINTTVDGGATAKLAVSIDATPEIRQREQEMRQWFDELKRKTEGS